MKSQSIVDIFLTCLWFYPIPAGKIVGYNYVMKSASKLTQLLLLVLLFLFLIFQPVTVLAEGFVASPVTLQLKWKHKFQFAGYYAALHKGFFQDEGLDVTLKEGGPGIAPIDKVLAGHEAFYGVEAGELLYERLRGKPLVAVASIYQHSPSVLITLKSSDLLTPHDLAGKRIGMQVQQQNIVEVAAMFVHEGVSLDALKLTANLPHPEGLQSLQDNTLDADYGYLTSEPYLIKQAGEKAHYIRPISYGIDFYGDVFFTTEQELRKNPDRVAAMRRAVVKGWEYAMRHPDEIIAIILENYASPEYPRDFLQYEAEQTGKLMQPDIVKVGHMNPDRWNRMADIMVSLKLVNNTQYLKGFLYDPDHPGPDWLNSAVYMLAASLLLLLSLGVGLFWLVRRLQFSVERKTETLHHEVERRTLAEQKLNHYSEVLEERLVSRSNELAEKDKTLRLLEDQMDKASQDNSRLLNRINDNLDPVLSVMEEMMAQLKEGKPDGQAHYAHWKERLSAALDELRKAIPASHLIEPCPERQALLVEDDELNQLVAKELLYLIGISAVVAGDGHQALKILQNQSFDLIFMDINMPGIDGYETTRRIRAGGNTTPIIALTATTVAGSRQRCLEAGMDDYLSKPFELRDLKATTERWIDTKVVAIPVTRVGK